MQWFGNHFGAGIYESGSQIPIPVGEKCMDCGQKFIIGDDGFAMPFVDETAVGVAYYHRICLLENLGCL